MLFPLTPGFSTEEIEQRCWKCVYTLAKEDMLHYWVVLPKSFEPLELERVAFPDVSLTNIGRYLTRDDSLYLEVRTANEKRISLTSC